MVHWLLETDDWPARLDCGLWPPWLVALHVGGNLTIALAYLAIPLILGWVIRRHPSLLPSNRLGWYFVAFIFFCGSTHAWDAVMFWFPAYRAGGVFRTATAAVSLLTVWELSRFRHALAAYKTGSEHGLVLGELERKTVELADANRKKDDLIAALHGTVASLEDQLAAKLHNRLTQHEYQTMTEQLRSLRVKMAEAR